jgi:hypothetical protein
VLVEYDAFRLEFAKFKNSDDRLSLNEGRALFQLGNKLLLSLKAISGHHNLIVFLVDDIQQGITVLHQNLHLVDVELSKLTNEQLTGYAVFCLCEVVLSDKSY